jgi:hypothetical protein
MTEQEFNSRMAQAETMCGLSDRPGYYEGYMRGLCRFYHGPRFGTLQGHEKWLALGYDWDKNGAGRGYRDGLQGIRPHTRVGGGRRKCHSSPDGFPILF